MGIYVLKVYIEHHKIRKKIKPDDKETEINKSLQSVMRIKKYFDIKFPATIRK